VRPSTKVCAHCGKKKNGLNFSKAIYRTDGLNPYCKPCVSGRKKFHTYGITEGNYEKLLREQNGVCAICHEEEVAKIHGKIKTLSVDHDHKTGKVRGLLCSQCNPSFGMLKESETIILSMLSYLRKHS
jgi:hypothetical protein